MSWIGYVIGFFGLIVAAPVVIFGYIELVKKDQKTEIEELVNLLETKDNLTEQEDLFIVIAKQHLNNLEKND
tara:strand:+ start:9755 stop:9970 length:216 start_codon:yes stop_codon:yes gene_type:complete